MLAKSRGRIDLKIDRRVFKVISPDQFFGVTGPKISRFSDRGDSKSLGLVRRSFTSNLILIPQPDFEPGGPFGFQHGYPLVSQDNRSGAFRDPFRVKDHT